MPATRSRPMRIVLHRRIPRRVRMRAIRRRNPSQAPAAHQQTRIRPANGLARVRRKTRTTASRAASPTLTTRAAMVPAATPVPASRAVRSRRTTARIRSQKVRVPAEHANRARQSRRRRPDRATKAKPNRTAEPAMTRIPANGVGPRARVNFKTLPRAVTTNPARVQPRSRRPMARLPTANLPAIGLRTRSQRAATPTRRMARCFGPAEGQESRPSSRQARLGQGELSKLARDLKSSDPQTAQGGRKETPRHARTGR